MQNAVVARILETQLVAVLESEPACVVQHGGEWRCLVLSLRTPTLEGTLALALAQHLRLNLPLPASIFTRALKFVVQVNTRSAFLPAIPELGRQCPTAF